MTKTIPLPEFDTDEIRLSTDQMTAIALTAIKKEAKPKWWHRFRRKKQTKQAPEMKWSNLPICSESVINERYHALNYFYQYVQAHGTWWMDKYNAIDRSRVEQQYAFLRMPKVPLDRL